MIAMYKTFSRWKLFSFSILIVNLILIVGCNKNKTTVIVVTAPSVDTTPPIVTLKGNAKDSMTLGSNYTDAGATALDDRDGDISSSITVIGTVNNAVKGTYTLEYVARDAARNSSEKVFRTVKVKNDVDYLEGDYAVSYTCVLSTPGMVTPTITVSNDEVKVRASSTNNNSFHAPTIDSYVLDGLLTVNGFSISSKYIYNHGDNPIYGSGTISPNKKSFTINVTEIFLDNSNVTKNCTAVFTKQ